MSEALLYHGLVVGGGGGAMVGKKWSMVPVLVNSGVRAGCSSPTRRTAKVSCSPAAVPATKAPCTTASSTSTTAATTPALVLPSAPPCDSQPRGGSGIRPTTIFLGCATGDDHRGAPVWNWSTLTPISSTNSHNCRPNLVTDRHWEFPVGVQFGNPSYLDRVAASHSVTPSPTTEVGATEFSMATRSYGARGRVAR